MDVERADQPLRAVHHQQRVDLVRLHQLRRPLERQSRGLRSIVDRVRPSVETLLETGLSDDALIRHAVRGNVRVSASHLRHGSESLERLIEDDGLVVVGAEYSLETGEVEFFDDAVARLPARPGKPWADGGAAG